MFQMDESFESMVSGEFLDIAVKLIHWNKRSFRYQREIHKSHSLSWNISLEFLVG